MGKFILGMVVGLVLAAVCSAVYLGLDRVQANRGGERNAAQQAPVAALAAPAVKRQAVVAAKPMPATEAANAPAEETAAATDAPAAAPVAASFDDDAAALVKGLSMDQEEKLARLLNERAMKRMMEENKYRTASSWRIDMLNHLGKPELRLSDAQRQQLKQAREALKPQMDAALGSYWTRTDEIAKAIQESYKGGMCPEEMAQIQEKNKPLYAEMNLIRQQMAPLQQQLDQQYQAAANAILSPEQQKAVADMSQGFQWSGNGSNGGGATWAFSVPGGGGSVTGSGGGTIIVQPSGR